MKTLGVAASVLLMSVGLAAQGPPAKGLNKSKSTITVTVENLNCTTSTGAGAFDVLAWSWGASNAGDVGSGSGGGAGKAVVSDLSVTKAFDACSPALFGGVVTGKAFPTLTLTQANSDGTTTALTLTDVRISSWQASGTAAHDTAAESVSFAFAKVCLTDGASGSKVCYDARAAKTF